MLLQALDRTETDPVRITGKRLLELDTRISRADYPNTDGEMAPFGKHPGISVRDHLKIEPGATIEPTEVVPGDKHLAFQRRHDVHRTGPTTTTSHDAGGPVRPDHKPCPDRSMCRRHLDAIHTRSDIQYRTGVAQDCSRIPSSRCQHVVEPLSHRHGHNWLIPGRAERKPGGKQVELGGVAFFFDCALDVDWQQADCTPHNPPATSLVARQGCFLKNGNANTSLRKMEGRE